jgi:hypothetical protein
LPIIFKYYKKEFTEENLYPNLAQHSSENLGNELEEKWQEEENSRKSPSLLRALYRMFGREFMLQGAVLLVLDFVVTYVRML